MTDTELFIQAMETVANIFGWRDKRVDEAIKTVGANPVFFMFRCADYEIAYIGSVRRCFHMEVSIRLTVEPNGKVNAEISWASGGGTPGEALAQLAFQTDMAQKLAQAEMVMNDAVRHFRKSKEALGATLAEIEALAKADRARVFPLIAKGE